MLAFALRYREHIYCRNIADGQQITFGSGKKDTLQIREMAEEQLCIRASGERITMQTRPPSNLGRKPFRWEALSGSMRLPGPACLLAVLPALQQISLYCPMMV